MALPHSAFTIQVTVESEAAATEQDNIRRALESLGLNAEVRAAYIRESAVLEPWLISLSAGTISVLLGNFLRAAGEDAWKALKRVCRAARDARQDSRAPNGEVFLTDDSWQTRIPLPEELPDEAYRKLFELTHYEAPLSGILHWDYARQEWVDALHGKLPCDYPRCTSPGTEIRIKVDELRRTTRRTFCPGHVNSADAGDPRAWQ